MTHEVTNAGIDKDQLSSMAGQARDALDADTIEVLADKGYFNVTLPHGNHDNLLPFGAYHAGIERRTSCPSA